MARKNSSNSNNIFTLIHQTADGEQMPIVGMADQHLLNTIKLLLVKRPDQARGELVGAKLGGFAPEGMSKEQARLLNLKFVTPQQIEAANAEIDEEVSRYLTESLLPAAIPYLIVGLIRKSTSEKVLEVIRQVFPFEEQVHGVVTQMIATPRYMLGASAIEADQVLAEDWIGDNF